MSDDFNAHKTGRISILCITIAILGLLFFLFKVNACASCNLPEECRDEFIEIKTDYMANHACKPGAIVETVSSPPAPRPGIICRCKTPSPEASASPPPVPGAKVP